ncbi:hypothetical protein FOPG_16740 [Fusarium oxysporum f. sp. conglutinans race 2 54008]|uniref:Uncharacterized protein n=2 Tax=Fusarium oxysporum f. sp. conglutinans TaxID=100902 RepID=F9F8C5_FUSOF|nr:hypothetical protein FOXB_02650 [Fusarium oxysporum f. sp. conglutinans Fo5176]EXL67129.1 hypothetical protein FOPG_16740 [Fusarium oxysporum f. sp. conglutinans race 2 54008]KAG6985684.1 hypothetical protein FocnCong_v003740 [Fusarium oxysporum f. sp. conglutinans]KAI8405723.1 hypothetical protein FOFC_15211 [Fusarium oxysporum]
MASTEDLMDTSLATQRDSLSPSITPSLNHVDISLRTQHDSLSPPLTPVLNHADISLPTQHGSSSPLSPQSGDSPLDELKQLERCMDLFVRRSLENNQRDQQILNQLDQLLHHRTSATADSLVEDATDLGGILLSLANIEQILFPHKLVSSMIEESKEQPLLLFILGKLYQLRQNLQLPDRYLRGEIKHLEGYVNELHEECAKHGRIPVLNSMTIREDPFLVILARLKVKRPDIGPINYHGVKKTDFAIILGCLIGSMGCYANASYVRTHSEMLQIGTAVACGGLEASLRSWKPLEEQ